jgi:class 3 adenylate cyclase/tetratricopeptide (TPR) repeat protein
MAPNKNHGSEQGPSHIEKILEERERLEELLKEKYRREVVILFTDICGYTDYIDKRGDISGRALLLKHNRILLPIIERHDGKVVEIIGDAVMACFPSPLTAVKSAVTIQQALQARNQKTEPADRIHVRIGIHSGEALVDEGRVFQGITGDVANVASRIQSHAGKDEILTSKIIYEKVCGSEDILCRFHKTIHAKGKEELLDVYKVVWRDEEVVVEAEPKIRFYESTERNGPEKPINVIYLDVARQGDHLKLSIQERIRGQQNTIQQYDEIPVSMDVIGSRCLQVVETLNKANRRGRLTKQVLMKLREMGQIFHDELFTINVKEKLESSKAEYLCLSLDDQLGHIPWELVNDGQRFLCRRFNMGRLVKTRQTILGTRLRELGRPLRMLIMADPSGDLKGAYAEGTQLRDFMDQNRDVINATLRSSDITTGVVKETLRNFDIVHFAGHAEYHTEKPDEGGWRVSNGVLAIKDITRMAGTGAMPALIFSNACQSARTEEWRIGEDFQSDIFGLANVFLLVGVKHYVGTFWEIMDEPSRRYALKFYRSLISGLSVGEGVREARLELIKEFGEETIVWASYVLYGDPTFNYIEEIEKKQYEEAKPPPIRESVAEVRTREEVLDFSEKGNTAKSRRWWAGAVGIVLVMAGLLWVYPGFLSKGTGVYEREALAHFEAGDYSEAVEVCRVIQERNPKRSLGYLILGNIHFLEGDLEKATLHFRKAVEAQEGTDTEKAEALLGLGRISSLEKRTDEALDFYRQAAHLAPKNPQPYVSQGMVLYRQGRHAEAVKQIATAQAISPGDFSLQAFADEVEQKAAIAESKEKREKIDRLVRELLEGLEKAPQPTASDAWTSFPLTLWLMDFESSGQCLREGEESLIAFGIMDRLVGKSRVQIVERGLLDKLLEELKLGTSRLADPTTALSLGRIMAARLILSGQVIHTSLQTQVVLRLIETETGEVKAAMNEIFVGSVPASAIAEKLSEALVEKLSDLFPLRGKVSAVGEKGIIFNIGRRHGAAVGQQFRVPDTEWILEVSDVDQGHSTAKVKRGYGTIEPGARVELLQGS